MDVIEFISTYKLLAVFFGSMFLGEFVIIPVLYLAVLGYFDIASVFVVMFFGALVFDNMWYLLGRTVPREKLFSFPVVRTLRPTVDRLHTLFHQQGERFVFYSKFVMGTRIITEILAGLHEMPVGKFVRMNALAVFVWMLGLTTLAVVVHSSVTAITNAVFYTYLGFGIFIGLALLGAVGTRLVFKYVVLRSAVE